MYVDLYPIGYDIGYGVSLATSVDLSEVPVGVTVAFPSDLYWKAVMKLREYKGIVEMFRRRGLLSLYKDRYAVRWRRTYLDI